MISEVNLFSGPWQPYFSKEVIWSVTLGVSALWIWVYIYGIRKQPVLRTSMLLMRLVILFLLGFLLMGPSQLKKTKVLVDRPQVSILVDTSGSMKTADMDGKTRLEVARETWLSDATIAKLSRVADYNLYSFDTHLKPLAGSALAKPVDTWKTGRATNLSGSINRLITMLPPDKTHAVLLISDGHDTTMKPINGAAKIARERKVPIHCVPLGNRVMQTDVSLHAIAGQEYLLQGEPGTIEIQLFQVGANNRNVEMDITCGDWSHSQTVAFERRSHVSVRIPIKHETPGSYPYSVSIKPLSEEKDTFNNAQDLLVNVTSERLKMLLVEGQPYWETKFIADSIRKDEGLELTQLVQTTTKKREKIVTRKGKGTVDVPNTASEWATYDVVILGRQVDRIISPEQAKALVTSINELGVQVVLARGRPYDATNKAMATALRVIEPVYFENGFFQDRACELTDLGVSHPTFFYINSAEPISALIRTMPPMLKLHAVKQVKAGVSVLVQSMDRGQTGGEGSPVITTMTYGRGRILSILGEGMWQWKIVGSQDDALKNVYDRYWSNTVRWLAMGTGFQPGESVTLQLSHQTMEKGKAVSLFVRTRGQVKPQMTLFVEGPGKTMHPLNLDPDGDRYVATYKPLKNGVHTVTLNSSTKTEKNRTQVKRFNVYDNNIELRQADARPDVLKSLANFTNGQVFHLSPDDLIDSLERKQLETLVPDRLEYRWDHGFLLTLLLGWLGLEWLIRKKGGLL